MALGVQRFRREGPANQGLRIETPPERPGRPAAAPRTCSKRDAVDCACNRQPGISRALAKRMKMSAPPTLTNADTRKAAA
jgi:hypothetical protein